MSDAAKWAGRFVWRDLMSTDVETSKGFYSELFGWTFESVPMGEYTYTAISVGGNTAAAESMIGGLMPFEVPESMGPFPSHWMSYLTVADVDASCARTAELGGKVCVPAFDLPTVGRTAVVEDPNGAVFHLFTSNTPGASATDGPPPLGHFCWTQLLCRDTAAVAPFYSGLVGWEVGTSEYTYEGALTCKRPGDEWPLCSILGKPAEAPEDRDQWLPYVNVESCAESTARAEQLGATLTLGVTDLHGMGIFSVLTDPAGAQIALWQSVMAPPKPE